MTEEQFNKIHSDNQKKLLSYSYSLVKDVQRAEEVVQEAFVRLYRQEAHLKLEAEPARWLFVVCRNLSFKHLAKNKRVILLEDVFKRRAEENKCSREDTLLSLLATDRTFEAVVLKSPLEILTRDEEQQDHISRMTDALGELTARQKRILELRYFQEMSYGDIAKAMNITEGNAGFLLHRAKKKLKAAYNSLNPKNNGR